MVIQRIALLRIVVTGSFAMLVTGCGTAAKDYAEAAAARKGPALITHRVNKDIAATTNAVEGADRYHDKSVDRATRPHQIVKIPRKAKWLRKEVGELSYGGPNATLEVALMEILGPRPYRFDIDTVNDPAFAPTSSGSAGTTVLNLPNGEVRAVPAPDANPVQKNPRTMLVQNDTSATTIKQHLDSISVQTGLDYQVEDNVVVFTNISVKVFTLKANTITQPQTFLFGNQSTEESRQENSRANLYENLNQGLVKIVNPPAAFHVDANSNSVTIRGTKSILRAAEKYISSLNYISSRRVAVRLSLYDVNLSALGQRSLDFRVENLISDWDKLEGFVGNFNIDGGGTSPISGGGEALTFGVDRPGGSLDGAQGLVRYLRGKGAITSRSQKEYVLANNQQVNEIRTRITPYVSGVTIEGQNAGLSTQSTTPSIETDEANTGTAIQLHPTINTNGVCIQLTTEESRLIRQDPFSFGGNDGTGLVAGSLPVTEVSQSQYPFCLLDGETIAIAGNISSVREHELTNASIIPVLGDAVDKSETRIQTLVVVSANIMD